MAIAIGRGLGRPYESHNGLDVPELLLLWRDEELTVAQGKFSRLSRHDLEDIYDDTADFLRHRSHKDEEHLQRALRVGVRLRGLRLIRDRNTRERVIGDAAPGIVATAELQAWSAQPEQALLAQEDGVIISEFVAELTPEECQVFALIAEGQSYRAIATSLGIEETEARNLTRECENKRKRFVTLYTTGRLCGYRSWIIDCLLSGEQQGELAVRQAAAHCSTAVSAKPSTRSPVHSYAQGSTRVRSRFFPSRCLPRVVARGSITSRPCCRDRCAGSSV